MSLVSLITLCRVMELLSMLGLALPCLIVMLVMALVSMLVNMLVSMLALAPQKMFSLSLWSATDPPARDWR